MALYRDNTRQSTLRDLTSMVSSLHYKTALKQPPIIDKPNSPVQFLLRLSRSINSVIHILRWIDGKERHFKDMSAKMFREFYLQFH